MLHLANRKELVSWLPKDAIVAEVGVERGDLSELIIQHARPAELHLIDAWEFQDPSIYPDTTNPSRCSARKQNENYRHVRRRFSRMRRQGKVFVHKGLSGDILPRFPNEYFDWIYLDANHRFSFVTKDLKLSNMKVKKKGFICGHDYCEGNPFRVVRYGVIKAVELFCQLYNWELIALADDFHKGVNFASYVLKRRDLSVRCGFNGD